MSELTPVTREEMYLDEIADALENGGGGGGAAVYNATITIQKNGTKVDDFTANQRTDKTINITVPTTAADVSALPDTTKYAAALSLTINSSTFVMTGQLKDQNGDNLGTAQTIDLPLESVVVGGSYNSQTKKVVLTLQNGNTIEFSVADLVSGLQTELSASNKLNPAYIDYDSTHRAVSDTEKSTWNGKQNAIDSSHKLSADLIDDTNATNKFATAAELEQIETNKNNISKITPELIELVDSGAKNLFKNDATTGTVAGVTYTVNTDGTVSTANTSTGFAMFEMLSTSLTFDYDVVLSGCPAGGNYNTGYSLYVANAGGDTIAVDTGNGALIPANTSFRYVRILARNGTNMDGKVFKPMVCSKAAWDVSQNYAQYVPTNAELYEMIKALQS